VGLALAPGVFRASGLAPGLRLASALAPAALLLVAIAVAALALTGCGLGAGTAPGGVRLLLTRDFGARPLRAPSAPRVRGSETVMSLLIRNAST
jgi:hypothetical protein